MAGALQSPNGITVNRNRPYRPVSQINCHGKKKILRGHAWHFQNIHGKSMELCLNPWQMPISMEKGHSAMANGGSFAMEKEICPWRVTIPPWKEELYGS